MNPGLRYYKRASCRIAIPEGLPVEFQDQVREVLSVASDDKRGGQASALMYQICTEADFAWITLMLHVKPFADGMGDEQLKSWYGKFGFVEIQADPLLMARSPQPPKIRRLH